MSPQTVENVRLLSRDHLKMDSPRVSRWLAAALFPLRGIFVNRFFRIEVTGLHVIPSTGPFVLAPTHRSRWDPIFLLTAVTNRLLYFMVSHDEVVGVQGWVMRRMGAFPITVHRPMLPRSARSSKSSREAMPSSSSRKAIFSITTSARYTRSSPGLRGLRLQFQKGCPDGDLPIIPVRLIYSDRLLRAKSRVKVQFGEPISVREYAALPPREAAWALTAAMQQALGEEVRETGSADSLRQAIADRSLCSRPRRSPTQAATAAMREPAHATTDVAQSADRNEISISRSFSRSSRPSR